VTENCQGNLGTYYTDALSKNGAGRKAVQDVHNTLEGSHELAILSSKFTEGPCSLLKEVGDGAHSVAHFELFGERMVSQFRACLLFVVLQGSVEERLERRGW